MDTAIWPSKQCNPFYSTAIKPLKYDDSAFLPKKRIECASIAKHALICRIRVFNVDRKYALLIWAFTLPVVRFTDKIESLEKKFTERALSFLYSSFNIPNQENQRNEV